MYRECHGNVTGSVTGSVTGTLCQSASSALKQPSLTSPAIPRPAPSLTTHPSTGTFPPTSAYYAHLPREVMR